MKSEGGIGSGSGGEVCSGSVGSGGGVSLVVGVDVSILRDLFIRTSMMAMAATTRQKRMIGVMLIERFLEDGVAVSRGVAVAVGSSEVVNMGVAAGVTVGVGVADRDADTNGVHPAETRTVSV